MKCSYCGTELTGRETFCGFCGTRQIPGANSQIPAAEKAPVFDEKDFTWQPYPLRQPEPAQEDLSAMEPPEQTAPLPPEPKQSPVPKIKLPTRRSWVRMVFLGILTLGIYPLVIWSRIATELNIAASCYDGERTMPYFAMLLLAPLTLLIYPLVWTHGLCRRIGAELHRRDICYAFGPRHFWLWNVLGSLILVGPFIFLHKLTKSMNLINGDYNTYG